MSEPAVAEDRRCQCPCNGKACEPCANEITQEDLLCDYCRKRLKDKLWHCHLSAVLISQDGGS
jgi:hypothetical protein